MAAALRSTPGFQLAAVLDRQLDAAQRLAGDSQEIQLFQEPQAFFQMAAELDAVLIATTANSHVPLALQAIDAGCKRIFLEKPVATCLADAQTLETVADRAGCRIAVNHTRRYLNSYQGLKRLLSRNLIGPARAIHFLSGAGGLAMMGTHMFEAACYLFESRVQRVVAYLDSATDPTLRSGDFEDPCGHCLAHLESGVRVFLDLSADLSHKQLYFVIQGAFGRIEVDERAGQIRILGSSGQSHQLEFLYPGALTGGISAGLLALLGNQEYCTVAEGRHALEAVVACHQSQASGQQVSLPVAPEWSNRKFKFA